VIGFTTDIFHTNILLSAGVQFHQSEVTVLWSVNWLNDSMTDIDCNRIAGTNVAGFFGCV